MNIKTKTQFGLDLRATLAKVPSTKASTKTVARDGHIRSDDHIAYANLTALDDALKTSTADAFTRFADTAIAELGNKHPDAKAFRKALLTGPLLTIANRMEKYDSGRFFWPIKAEGVTPILTPVVSFKPRTSEKAKREVAMGSSSSPWASYLWVIYEHDGLAAVKKIAADGWSAVKVRAKAINSKGAKPPPNVAIYNDIKALAGIPKDAEMTPAILGIIAATLEKAFDDEVKAKIAAALAA